MTYSDIYEMSVEKANAMCCLNCEMDAQLEPADSEVLVCKNCGYSIDAVDLQPEWQEKLENELGFYD